MELFELLSGKKVIKDRVLVKKEFFDVLSRHTPYVRFPEDKRKKELEKEWKHFEKMTKPKKKVDKEE